MLKRLKLYAESWNVAVREKVTGSILEDRETPFTVIKNNVRYWAADPFLYEFHGKIYIFSELYDYVRCRGIIGYYDLSEEKKWMPAIIESYHLSYPCIWEYKNEIYMMPEASGSNSLYLYKAVEFPAKWKKVKVLRENVRYADTTPLKREHNVALTYQVKDSFHPELYFIDFTAPEKDKKLELQNVELRRPAGHCFEKGERWIRPAQNCIGKYGAGLVFYSFMLQDGIYEEKELQRIFPFQLKLTKKLYLDGMHTYNATERYEVIDIKTRRFNLINLFFRTFGKLFYRRRRKDNCISTIQ